MTRPPFPAVIDSSLIAAFRSCPQKAYKEFVEHWKPRDPSVHLHAGASFARGLEVAREAFYVKAQSPHDSIAAGLRALIQHYGEFECPPDSPKSLERMAGALEFYFDRYPLGQDKAIPMTLPGGKRGIEFSFLEPLGLTHPQYLVMLALWEDAPTRFGTLAARLSLDLATLSPLVRRLEAAGLVERRRGADDARVVELEPTEAGRALRERAVEVPVRIVERLGIPIERLEALRSELTALIEAVAAAERRGVDANGA